MAKNTGIAQFSQGRSDVHRVDPRTLTLTEGWNTRDENDELTAHIEQLAQSIAEIGVKKPLEVKLEDGKLVIKDGHCRYRATMLAIKNGADIKTVPVISVDRYASDEELILNQVISNSGKPLTAMEQAKVFKKLLDFGWNQADIAKKVGMSNGRISQILSLLTMPVAAQALVASGAVSASLASKTVNGAETPQAGADALQKAVDAAAKAGRSKVKPADTGTAQKMTVKECFENSDIDNSDADAGFVTIKMPTEEWEFIRGLFKL
jgi:ParB family chromosome partitioning protein